MTAMMIAPHNRVHLSPSGLIIAPDLAGQTGTITEVWPETETVSIAWSGGCSRWGCVRRMWRCGMPIFEADDFAGIAARMRELKGETAEVHAKDRWRGTVRIALIF